MLENLGCFLGNSHCYARPLRPRTRNSSTAREDPKDFVTRFLLGFAFFDLLNALRQETNVHPMNESFRRM